jgi:hypothetical protein
MINALAMPTLSPLILIKENPFPRNRLRHATFKKFVSIDKIYPES